MACTHQDDPVETTPPGGRRAARKARTREAIMSAAAEVFAERGYGSAALEEIARRAEVSIGSVYAHFPGGKQALFLAALAAHTQEDLRIAEAALAELDGPGFDRLADHLGRVADSRMQALLDGEAWLYALRHDDELSDQLRAHFRRSQQDATRVVREHRTGTTGPFDDEELGVLALAVVEGLFRRRHFAPDAVPTTLFLRALDALVGESASVAEEG